MISAVPGIKYMSKDGEHVVEEIPIDVDLSDYTIILLQLRREFMMIELDECKRLRRKFVMSTNGRNPSVNVVAKKGLQEASLLCFNIGAHIKELTDVINCEDSINVVYKLAV